MDPREANNSGMCSWMQKWCRGGSWRWIKKNDRCRWKPVMQTEINADKCKKGRWTSISGRCVEVEYVEVWNVARSQYIGWESIERRFVEEDWKSMMVASGEKRKEMFLLEIVKKFVFHNLGPLAPRWFDRIFDTLGHLRHLHFSQRYWHWQCLFYQTDATIFFPLKGVWG